MTKLGVCSQQALRWSRPASFPDADVGSYNSSGPSRPYRRDRQGPPVGQPVTVEPAKLDYAGHLRTTGRIVAEIVIKTGIPAPASTGTYRPGRPTRSPPANCPPP